MSEPRESVLLAVDTARDENTEKKKNVYKVGIDGLSRSAFLLRSNKHINHNTFVVVMMVGGCKH